MTHVTTPYRQFHAIPRSEEQCIREARERQPRRMPLGDNDRIETDGYGTYGRDDMDACIPLIMVALAEMYGVKRRVVDIYQKAPGSAGVAAFEDTIGWIKESIEDLDAAKKAYEGALRDG